MPDGELPNRAADDDPSHLRSWRLGVVVTSLCLGVVLYGLDMNIIGVAIPVITTEFKSLDDIAWYGAAYLLTITAFQPFFGNMYKYFDAKAVYLVSIVLFEVGSVVCATASKSSILIFGRAFLGFGAAGLLQGALAIVSYIVKLEKVPMYQGIVAGAAAVSAAAGPVIGGALTDHVSWRWCFWINAPVGGAVIICVFLFVNISPKANREKLGLSIKEKLKHLDFVGTIFFLGSIVSLLLVLQWGGRTISWNSGTSIGLFITFGVCLIAFIALQWKLGEYATIPPRIIKVRSIYMGAIVLFALGISSIALAYYLPLYFQATRGVSATTSGVYMIAYVAPTIVSIGITGAVVSRVGYYVPFMIVGITIAGIVAGFFVQIDAYTSTAKWVTLIVVHRLGLGMAQQLPYTALQAVLEPTDTATGNAIAIFSWQLGGAIAVSIGQNLLLNGLQRTIPSHTTMVSVSAVLEAGVGGLTRLAPNPAVLQQLREDYAEALRGTFILALVGTCVALPFAAGMQWLNIKTVAEERRRDREVKRLGESGIMLVPKGAAGIRDSK
ncbi:MFS multidrug transporter-like protein [Massariosphaeria phaeospora]|uniref:MFS multidrug transporter-like protein n=1 Tax=Massariosphaeria phaeospora TaxID=100035 RepID=A0A7C8I8B3_9PLEO|nr:MFS multidrug transporter-like protein [Massariosphaeria phaeospora]